jgi:hypothetical protein
VAQEDRDAEICCHERAEADAEAEAEADLAFWEAFVREMAGKALTFAKSSVLACLGTAIAAGICGVLMRTKWWRTSVRSSQVRLGTLLSKTKSK